MNRANVIPKLKRLVRFFLGVPLTLAAFYFIGLFLFNRRDEIGQALVSANYVLLTLGILCFAIFFFIKNIVWLKTLQKLGAKPDIAKSFFLLSFSETKRYIPGSIFSFVARVKSYSDAHIPVPILVKSLVIESLLLMLPALLVSIPAMFFIYPELSSQYPEYRMYLPLIFFGIIALSIAVICAAAIIAKKKLKVQHLSFRNIFVEYIDVFMISAVGWVFFGIGNYLVTASIHTLDPRFFLQFVSFFVLSWFIGYISILTPMGLGVREAILIVGLSPFAPLHITSLIALFSRVAFMAGEFLFLGLSFIPYHVSKVGKTLVRLFSHAHLTILWSAIISYITYFTYLSFAKYDNFFMGKFDLGNMDQTVWNTLHGRIFMFTDPDSVGNVSRLAYHADFILILLSPLYLIWSDPRMLLLVQSIVLGIGAYFVFKIAHHFITSKTLPLVIALSYLFNPMVQRQNLYDFHAVVLATTLLLAGWFFLLKKKYAVMMIFLLLAALCKENVWIVTTLIGVYLMIQKKYKIGALIATVSISMFLLLMKKFIPDARGGEHFALEYLAAFGDSTFEVAMNVLLHPLKTFAVFLEHDGIGYLTKLFLPNGFLMVLSPWYLLFAAPDIGKNILSSNSNLRDITYQYNAEIIPFLFIATIYSIVFLIKKGVPQKVLTYYVIFAMLLGAWMYGYLPGSMTAYLGTYTNARHNAPEIRAFLRTIPDNASVAAMNNVGSHLSQRQNIYVIPQGIEKADYILFLLTDWYEPPNTYTKKVEELKKDPRYELIYTNDKFYAFRKTDR